MSPRETPALSPMLRGVPGGQGWAGSCQCAKRCQDPPLGQSLLNSVPNPQGRRCSDGYGCPEPAKGSPCQDPPPQKKQKKTKKQLTSQLALPPFPHRCSRRVCRGKGEAAASPRGRTAPGGAPPRGLAAPTRCLNSAERLPLLDSSMFMTLVFVPRMLNFRDLKRGKKKTQCGRRPPRGERTGERSPGLKAEVRKKEKKKRNHRAYPRSAATSPESLGKGRERCGHGHGLPALLGGSAARHRVPRPPPPGLSPQLGSGSRGPHGHPAPSPGVTPALSAGMGLDLGAAGTCWDPKSSTQGQSTGLTCRCRL